jgi:hypothetical protein
LEEVCYHADIPTDIKGDVDKVFEVSGRLPIAWTQEVCYPMFFVTSVSAVIQDSKEYQSLSTLSPPNFLLFIQDAYNRCPSLFAEIDDAEAISELFPQVVNVFTAWSCLCKMLASEMQWSEADFVANVYVTYLVHPDIFAETLQV